MKKLIVAAVTIAAFMPAGLASARTESSETTISVTGKEFSFHLSKTSIPKPGTVTFSFHNVGTMKHDFHIGGKQTPLTSQGKTARLSVTFHKMGRFATSAPCPATPRPG